MSLVVLPRVAHFAVFESLVFPITSKISRNLMGHIKIKNRISSYILTPYIPLKFFLEIKIISIKSHTTTKFGLIPIINK